MALDHTRDFFHADAMVYDPTDLSKTHVLLFLTRWVTHFCAPVFMFLAGTSAFLVGQRKTKKELSVFLLTRGLWLVLLELTVVNFGWTFNITLPFFALITIWALGISMVALSLLIFLPFRLILFVGAVIILSHNLLDNIHVRGVGLDSFLWSALHDTRFVPDNFMFIGRKVEIGYPVLSWIGVIAVGYCFGYLYQAGIKSEQRKKWLLVIGISSIILFVIIRASNHYGDPQPWRLQPSTSFSILSFINVTKYPPSLLYILITLGPAILFLRYAEKPFKDFATNAIIHIGRVPMFFYLLHIYLIHILAMFAAKLSGYSWSDMVSQVPLTPTPKGYGYSLLILYLVWITVVLLLYPLCKWYDNYKSNHKEKWWLSYL
jgi:uncharacterized membrane protein